MTITSLDDLLTLRRLRERRAGTELARTRATASQAAEDKTVAERTCVAFAIERQEREQAAYASMAGQATPVRTIQSLAARIAEDTVQAMELQDRRNQAGAALVKAETSTQDAVTSHTKASRDVERLGELLSRLAKAARAAEERRDEAMLEETVRPAPLP